MSEREVRTPADVLYDAVKLVRSRASRATRGPWRRGADYELAHDYGDNFVGYWDGPEAGLVAGFGDGDQAEADARWACLVNPAVAEPLALWMETVADDMLDGKATEEHFPSNIPIVRWLVVDRHGKVRYDWTDALKLARVLLS